MSAANELNISTGSPLEFQKRPMLISGQIRKGPNSFLVLINSEDSRREQVVSLWHEVIHFIKLAGGLPPELHDEEEVEVIAKKLSRVCPEVYEWAFPLENTEDSRSRNNGD